MQTIHIIACFAAAVLLTGVYLAARVHIRESPLSKEKDFIDVFVDRRERAVRRAGGWFTVNGYLEMMLLSPAVLGVLLYLLTKNGGFSVLVGMLGIFAPELMVRGMERAGKKKFEERYAKSLEQLCSSLRAGMSIAQAVEDVAACRFLHESMQKRYAKLSSDLQMGLTVSEAFRRFAEGTGSRDAEDVALALDVQNQVGGHEAEVVEKIAGNIHSRMMLRREVQSIFSEVSSMMYIMDVLVPAVIIGFSVMNRQYVGVYFSSPTYIALFASFLALPLVGSVITHRSLNKIKKGA